MDDRDAARPQRRARIWIAVCASGALVGVVLLMRGPRHSFLWVQTILWFGMLWMAVQQNRSRSETSAAHAA